MNARQRIDKKLNEATAKWLDLIYASLAISFKRYWNWGPKRIQTVIDGTYGAWDECGEYGPKKSMIQMLEEETGIEIRCAEDPRSYKEIAFLYDGADTYKHGLTDEQYIYMRLNQIKWLRPVITAAVFLALYREHGFGSERLSRLLGQMDEVMQEYKYTPRLILKAANEEANFVMKGGCA